MSVKVCVLKESPLLNLIVGRGLFFALVFVYLPLMNLFIALSELSEASLRLLDLLLYALHLLIIGFNLLGWIWRRTRPLHLLFVALTAASWLLLGFWYGLGYCFVTDWQWQVKEQLGQRNLPASFIEHFLNGVLGFSFSTEIVDLLTGGLFALAALLSLGLYIRDRRKARKA